MILPEINLPDIKGIATKALNNEKSLMDMAACFRDLPGTVFLASGYGGSASYFSILGIRPWLTLSSKGERVKLSSQEEEIKANPFEILRVILEKYSSSSDNLPLDSGLMGYLSYDLGRIIENLPDTVMDDLRLPDLYLCAPSIIITEDLRTGQKNIHTIETDSGSHPDLIRWFHENLNKDSSGCGSYSSGKIRSLFNEKTYIKAVSDIKEYIAAGDVYQVNLSQRFEADFKGDPFSLFKDLFEANPASFFAYINAGDHFIVSTSPERFVSRKGRIIETRPIKGTRQRLSSLKEDEKVRLNLMNSPKDDAELSMIVDLMRNDFGRVANPGTVKVKSHKDLESFRNVHHLFSTVVAELDQSCDSVDFIKAVFPAGSITGCPKIRSMEIIDELEPVRRHIYTGSIGYIGFGETLDLSVAIRTCVIKDGRIYFSAGGGIVQDSDPKSEYEETLHKAETIMRVLNQGQNEYAKNEKSYEMWLNGFFLPDDTPFIRVSDQGANGVGFFETIYAEKGRVFFLEDHLERFKKAWGHILGTRPPEISYENIIKELLDKNGLNSEPARIRITCHAVSDNPGHSISVIARPYKIRPAIEKKGGLDLISFDLPQFSLLSEFKSTNRLFYDLASRKASINGADEAVILDQEGFILETNTANIILARDKEVIIPPFKNRLSGIMEKNVLKILAAQGYLIKEERIRPDDFIKSDGAYVTNSLMGFVAALSINGNKLVSDQGFSKQISDIVRKRSKAF